MKHITIGSTLIQKAYAFCPGYSTEGWMTWSSNKPIRAMADIKDFKMRIQGSKIMIENFRAYGGSPTSMDFGEVYSGLQMKLIEGQSNPIWIGYSMKFYEVQDYFTTAYDNIYMTIPCMNRNVYDSLPKEMQGKEDTGQVELEL